MYLVPRLMRDTRIAHASLRNATKYEINMDPHASARVVRSTWFRAARGPGERGGVPRGVCPRARVYAMRDGILSKEKGTPTDTCTRGQRARATATRPRRPQPTRQGEPGVAGAHTTAEARSPQHTAQQLTHTLTPTRQAAPAATTSTAATRRLLNVRPIVLLPRRRLEPAPCALRGSASAPLLVRDAHGEQPSLHVQASHFPLARKLHALERHRRERRQGV